MRESERVYEALLDEILKWEAQPGMVLGEAEISRRFGVSRTPVREALRNLERENLVQILPGRGATVVDVSLNSIAQLFQMREAVETYAARLAARHNTRAPFGEILDELVRARQDFDKAAEDDYAAYDEIGKRMDLAIQTAVNNVYLVDALRATSAHANRLRALAQRNPSRMREGVGERIDICRAIVDGDEQRAADLTAEHLHNSLQGILNGFIQDVTGNTLSRSTAMPPIENNAG